MDLPKPKQWATAYATKEFISINTCSGFRSSARDPEGREFFFSPDVSDNQLGEGVLQALSDSKFLSTSEVGIFFELSRIEKNYENWVESLIEKSGCKSRRALFTKMKLCLIDCVDGVITIKPTKHEKMEGWGGKGIDSNDYEIVPNPSLKEEVGKALKRCFSKCT